MGRLDGPRPAVTDAVADALIERLVPKIQALKVGPASDRSSEMGPVVTAAARACGATVHEGGTYVCMEGPLFSTRAESELHRSWGASLIGQSISEILPAEFRELHHSGFARFQLTETSKVVNHPLTLATICNDGTVISSEHYIVPEKSADSVWSFAATLRPLEGPHAQPR